MRSLDEAPSLDGSRYDIVSSSLCERPEKGAALAQWSDSEVTSRRGSVFLSCFQSDICKAVV